MRPMLVGLLLVGVLVVAAVSGQAQRQPDSMDDLITEVRGLRAEVNQAAGASIRAQLLVARLQLQEQRINALSQQLATVHSRVSTVSLQVERRADGLQELEDGLPRATPEKRTEIDDAVAHFRRNLDIERKEEQQLRGQEAEVEMLLATEQGRWMEFNSRLDELERQLPSR